MSFSVSRALQRYILLAFVVIILLYTIYNRQSLSSNLPYFSNSRPSHIDWSKIPTIHHPLDGIRRYPTDPPKTLPRIQAPAAKFKEGADEQKLREGRQKEVQEVFKRSWNAYQEMAWGHDELTPVTGSFKDHFGGWGCSLVDSLDTLLLMDMTSEFDIAVQKLREIDFSTSHMETLNLFETTTRYLGGLLGAHELANDRDNGVLLGKAKELIEFLLHAFDTTNRMPVARWQWMKNYMGVPDEAHAFNFAAEVGSMFLEFTKMSQVTGDLRYYDAVQRIAEIMASQQQATKLPGLWPVVFNAKTTSFRDDDEFSLGGRADSIYEYVSKGYLILGGASDMHRRMYENWITAAKEHIFFQAMNRENRDILFAGSVKFENGERKLIPETQHLTCYLGGIVAVGSKIFDRPDDLETAKQLVEGCIWAYESTASGIMPERFTPVPPAKAGRKNKWDKDAWLKAINEAQPIGGDDEVVDQNARAEQIAKSLRLPEGFAEIKDKRYILRAGAIESVFVLYRVTGDKRLQEVAYEMFHSITQATATEFSYSSIADVTLTNSEKTDASESFWMAETLKYFYLMFSSPDKMSLDEYVFNTEGHPFKIPRPM